MTDTTATTTTTGTKFWLASKTIWGNILTVIVSILAAFGVNLGLTDGDTTVFADGIATILGIAAEGQELSATAQAAISAMVVALVNIAFRFITNTGVTLTK